MITNSDALARFCSEQRGAGFVAIDTEFIRERTYWPVVCLIQVAGPEESVIVDALAPGIDLSPIGALAADPDIVKVFHGGREDLAIFLRLFGNLPTPVFDTQVAGMVCGLGEQASFEKMAAQLLNVRIEKTAQRADWSRRPLDKEMIHYALGDVVHLRDAYLRIITDLDSSGRWGWVEEELAGLINPELYATEPDTAWRRLKIRTGSPRFLAALQAAAAWREREAQRKDLPRQWVLRDQALIELARLQPRTPAALSKIRDVSKGFLQSRGAAELIEVVHRASKSDPVDPIPPLREDNRRRKPPEAVVELLRALLSVVCREAGVAPKLVADSADLRHIAADGEIDIPAMRGWRRELFGEKALALREGKVGLSAEGGEVHIVPLVRH